MIKLTMKIKRHHIDILNEISPQTYAEYIMYENGHRNLYVMMVESFYGMLVSSVLYCKKLRNDLENIGLVVNPYDICVVNCIVNVKQDMVVWHVDDIKSSHAKPKVIL